ncbi:TIGR04282 family arsenosugar biosynthesis glycosyltransferase [Pseudomonadota bacterium]
MRVIIMCKAPVAGRVKTRLTTVFTPVEAALIHQSMAETVIRKASTLFSDCLIASDDTSHPFFEVFNLPLAEQGEGDLGDRMSRLMQQAFSDRAGSVLFLGTDSPHIPDSRLRRAVTLLESYDVVIGPVEDGGYDLIAMRSPYIELFSQVPWSSKHLLQETIGHAERLGLRLKLLDMSFDLDTPESLQRAAPEWIAPVFMPKKDPEN